MTKCVIFLLAILSYLSAEEFKVVHIKAKTFLSFKTEISSTKDIGKYASKIVPELKQEAKENNFAVTGAIHHFYTHQGPKNFLEIALPIDDTKTYKGKFTVKKAPAYDAVLYVHKGPISKIGQSWDKLHKHVAKSGQLSSRFGTEIYTSGVKNLMSKETAVELHEHLIDKTILKGECFISGFAKNSQAKKLGLKKGDIIESYNDKKIKFSSDLIKSVNSNKLDSVNIIVNRNSELLTYKVNAGPLGIFLENR